MAGEARPDGSLEALIEAIVEGDGGGALQRLAEAPALALAALPKGATRVQAREWFLNRIRHYVYAGDTALHVAGAAYRPQVARALIAAGADVRARNRRGAQPLHYAADGSPGAPHWNPPAQAEVIAVLIAAGADANAVDMNGVAPLHRAVRTRCTAAVEALIAGGADVELRNGNGSTPMDLAGCTTGRGGSGSPEAKAQQALIVQLLENAGRR
jgi:hypothetical protein